MDELDFLAVTRRSIQSIVALISRTFILNIISFASFLVISTQLPARELGVYTAVIAIQRLISFFTDFGLGAALVQKKEEISNADIKTSFTLQSSITLAIVIGVLLLRTPIQEFFRLDQSAFFLLFALVVTIFLSSFKTIPSILLERKINFQKLIIPQIMESLIFNCILVVLILQGFGLTSFTYAFLVSSIVGIPIYYLVSPWKIALGIDREALSHLKFGIQFQAKNVLATLKDDLLTVILVKFLTFTEIGYIGFAQRLAFFVFRYVVDSVTKVTFSTYSRIHESGEHLRRAIEKSLFFVSSAMFPVLFGIIIIAPFIVRYFPGWQNKWEPAVISLVFFCLNAVVSALSSILVNVLDASGRVHKTLQLMVGWTILTWILTPIAIYLYGYNGVAIASFVVTLTIGITIYLVKQITPFSFFRSISKPLIATAIMSLVVFSLSQFVITSFITLIFVILLGGGVYLFSFYLLAKNEITGDIKKLFVKK